MNDRNYRANLNSARNKVREQTPVHIRARRAVIETLAARLVKSEKATRAVKSVEPQVLAAE